MSNQLEMQKQLTAQSESAGLAEERFLIWQEGVEAAQGRMTANWEEFWQKSIDQTAISGLYDFMSGVINLGTSIGGLNSVLAITLGLLAAMNATNVSGALSSIITMIVKMTAAQGAFNLTAMANPYVWIPLAIAGFVVLFNSIKTTEEKTQELVNSATSASKEILELGSKYRSISDLANELEELRNKSNKTTEETKRLLEVQNQLKSLMPELTGEYDEYGNFLISSTTSTEDLTKAIKELIDAKKEDLKTTEEQILKGKLSELKGIEVRKGEDYKKGGSRGGVGALSLTEEEKAKLNEEYKSIVDEIKSEFINMSSSEKESFISQLKEEGFDTKFIDIFSDILTGSRSGGLSPDERDGYVKVGQEIAEATYSGLAETMKALSDSTTEDLIQKSMKGELSFDDVSKIPEEYLSALDVVNGKLKLNIDTVKELQLAEAEQALQSAKNAGAKQSEIDVLQLYYDQLLQASQNTFGAFSQTAWEYDELLWTISNDAVAAGFSFVDLEGNALNSAESIHSFLASSDQAFNSFVQQAAIATGRSAQEIMNLINGMVAETYNNTVSMINSLGGMVGGLSPDERDEAKARGMNLPKVKQVTPVGGALFSGKTPSYAGKGGGGSSKDDSATKEAERLREIEKEISDARNDATKSLKNQLKIYKQMVDERKKLLETMKEERTYQQDLEEKQGNVADIQNQISELSLDDSAEAQAQVLALQEQLADAQQELGNLEFEHGIDQQQTALDNELSRVENLVENAIMAIEGIDASSLASFTSQLSTILAGLGSAVPAFHEGGVVGGRYESKENEQFAKLLRKEVVVTPDQMSNFMNKTLPTIMSGTPSVSSSLQGMEIGQLMNFNINGSLDKSVLPNIEKIANMVVDKLNDNMLIRGTKRGAGLFSA